MMKKHILGFCKLVGLLMFLHGVSVKSLDADDSRPNILFIMIDDLGWKDLNCQGSPQFMTPNIDQLAEEGIRFTDAYAASPVCSPTRASAITGLAPARHRITNHTPDRWSFYTKDPKWGPAKSFNSLAGEHTTIAETLKKYGYQTGFIGKWHLSGKDWSKLNSSRLPENQGFDMNIAGCAMGGPGGVGSFFAPYQIPNAPKAKKGEYLPYALSDSAITYMKAQKKKSQPFFLCLWYYTVHYPIEAPKELYDKVSPGKKPSPQERYRAMVHGMDNAVGRVLKSLETLGLKDNTLVVFTSDNGNLSGYSSASPLKASKGFLSEGGIRVPLIIRYPKWNKQKGVSAKPVITMDLVPTFLECAGIEVNDETYDGESLKDEIKQPGSMNSEKPLYFHYPNRAFHQQNKMGSAIRIGDYKYIQYYDDHLPVLYNLKDDIGETLDLSQPKPRLAHKMKEKLNAWLEKVGATYPRLKKDIPADELYGKK